ncbi:hypothetical protein ABBQ32_004265 [Trebouxia sp. C0010 RCD-2024]
MAICRRNLRFCCQETVSQTAGIECGIVVLAMTHDVLGTPGVNRGQAAACAILTASRGTQANQLDPSAGDRSSTALLKGLQLVCKDWVPQARPCSLNMMCHRPKGTHERFGLQQESLEYQGQRLLRDPDATCKPCRFTFTCWACTGVPPSRHPHQGSCTHIEMPMLWSNLPVVLPIKQVE